MGLVVHTTPQPGKAAAGCAPDAALRLAAALATVAAFSVILLTSGAALAQPRKSQGIVPEDKLEKLDATKFSRPTEITNKWLPMKPGTRCVYDGMTVEDDGKVVPHQVIINIIDLVKVIGGVRTRVSYDLDYTEGELEEAALTFFAQDDDGNVWRLGEYLEEYDGKKLAKAAAWIHGIEDARAGIMMQANPRLGTPSYSQGYGPAVNWTDRGQVHTMGEEVVIGANRYADALVIKETSEEEDKVGAAQLKYYAAGVGNIKAGWIGSADKSKEMLELTRVEQLDASQMAAVRAKALALERSAYRRSKNVYGRTTPATVEESAAR
jgi:hypothetical protein